MRPNLWFVAGSDLALNDNGDFIDADGDWESTSSIEPLARHQLLDERGRFFADVEAGSNAYLIPRKATRATMLRFQDAALEALGVFVALGMAEDLVVEISSDQLGRLALEGSLTDRNAGLVDLGALLGGPSYGLLQPPIGEGSESLSDAPIGEG